MSHLLVDFQDFCHDFLLSVTTSDYVSQLPVMCHNFWFSVKLAAVRKNQRFTLNVKWNISTGKVCVINVLACKINVPKEGCKF